MWTTHRHKANVYTQAFTNVLTITSVNTQCHSAISPFWCLRLFIHIHNCPDTNCDLRGLDMALRGTFPPGVSAASDQV